VLVQASISSHRIAKPLDLVPDVQHPVPEIYDHQIIRRALEQRFLDLIFKRLLPSFEIENVI